MSGQPQRAAQSTMTSLVPLIETTRGGTPECLHFGAVAVTDTQGRVLAHAGDPHWLTFTRSTLKALQALPFMQADGPQALGFTPREPCACCARATAASPCTWPRWRTCWTRRA